MNARQESNPNEAVLPVRVPKKILHFSDGTLEVYSDDEDETDTKKESEEPEIDAVCKFIIIYILS